MTLAAFAQQGTDESSSRYLGLERPSEEVWPRHFRVGMLVGLNLKADFSTSGQFGISGGQPGATGVSGVEHFYDDGYVRVDQTGNAQGYTSFWGYNNASQYSSVGNTLTMHSAKSFNANSGSSGVGDSAQVGLDMAYGGHLFLWRGALVGWELGFGWLPISVTDDRSFSGVATRTVHTFNTAGIVVPTAPYNGGNSGIGPTIRDTATALPDDTTTGNVTGSRTLDATLYSFRLGPTLHWELHPQWAVAVSGGAAVGFVSGDLKYNETLLLADGTRSSNSGKVSGTDVTYGGYLSGTVMYHAVEHGDFFLSAQYMPMGNALIGGGGRQARLNMAGSVYISAGINWPF